MLTTKYYDEFAKILKKRFMYEKQLFMKNIVNGQQYTIRKQIIRDLCDDFIIFMLADNSQFNEYKFKNECGYNK